MQLIFKEPGVKAQACWGLTFTPCYQALKTAINEMLLPLIYMNHLDERFLKKQTFKGRTSDITSCSLLELCVIQPHA